jgi:tRNA-binding EMAP/Myf-like protein
MKIQIIAGCVCLLAFLSGCGGAPSGDADGPADAELTVGMPGGVNDDGQIPAADGLQPPDVNVDPKQSTRVQLSELPNHLSDQIIEDTGKPESWQDWSNPDCVLAVSGQQYGYIEPCGCTGLANQKGGMMRRYTLLEQVRSRGWEVLPVDAGNQVRRTGRQAAIKFQTAVKGLSEMQYRTVGFGPDDLKLGASELLSVAGDDGESTSPFVTANVELLAPGLVPVYNKQEVNGRSIGITTAIDPQSIKGAIDDGIIVSPLRERVAETLTQMKADGCQTNVLLLFGNVEAAETLAREVPGFDLIVAAQTNGEPHYEAELIEGTETRLVKTGDKGMYIGLIGLFPDNEIKYSRVALDDQFEDARPILDLMASYQEQLRALDLSGLQVKPLPHPSGNEYVGTERCGECHTTAYEIWQGTPHAEATEDIVHPGERSEIPRHFDPECLSCHVTGWNPQGFHPYTTGYLSLEASPALTGSGCENCHGPGRAHAEAEEGGDYTEEEIQRLRESVRLLLADARTKCLECHDLDNSPDFHLDGAFEEYWSQVEHYGVD